MTAQLDLFSAPPPVPASEGLAADARLDIAMAKPPRIGDWVVCDQVPKLRTPHLVVERGLEDMGRGLREVLRLASGDWPEWRYGHLAPVCTVWAREARLVERRELERSAGHGEDLLGRQVKGGVITWLSGAMPAPGRFELWARVSLGGQLSEYRQLAELLEQATTPAPASRPCWEWCGRPGPAPGCHRGSRYAARPVVPCLMCGREVARCESFSGGVICSPACDHLSAACRGGPAAAADFARAWLPEQAREAWEERVAIQAAEGVAGPEARALVAVWRQITLDIDPMTIRRA